MGTGKQWDWTAQVKGQSGAPTGAWVSSLSSVLQVAGSGPGVGRGRQPLCELHGCDHMDTAGSLGPGGGSWGSGGSPTHRGYRFLGGAVGGQERPERGLDGVEGVGTGSIRGPF